MKKIISTLLLALMCLGLSSCNQGWISLAYPQPYVEQNVVTILSPLENKYHREEPVLMEFTVLNRGNRTVRVCRWNSPLEGDFSEDYLRIRRKKSYLSYKGRRVRRRQALIKSYVSLRPGESLSTVVDISEGYDLHKKGSYTIVFEGDAYNHLPPTEPVEFKMK